MTPTHNFYVDLDEARNAAVFSGVTISSTDYMQVELDSSAASPFAAISRFEVLKNFAFAQFQHNLHARYQKAGQARYKEIDPPSFKMFYMPHNYVDKTVSDCEFEELN